ncbi:MAG: hypothetical protein HY234_16315 [Acidobacteria bacterium]|nr:hypothetical protein [Acidobacteriota bacterium]
MAGGSSRFHQAVQWIALLALLCAGCGGGITSAPPPPPPPPPGGGPFSAQPINDLGAGTYLGFTGGLYPNGSNAVPAAHNSAGLARANAVQSLDTSGNPSPTGKIVLLSIGMSNTTQEFCSAGGGLPCNSWTFMGQAAADAGVNKTTLALVNGAAGGQVATAWDSPVDSNYDRVRAILVQQLLSEQQVQVVWVKVAQSTPTVSLPSAQSDAVSLLTAMGNIARTLKGRYPNVRLVFFSSRIYGGYATTTLNPEPYAYESGFAVKWVVQAQIDQMANGGTVVDARAGDLNYNSAAPWIAWGPYLWANGLSLRSDGLMWQQADMESDGTHPSQSGEQKVGTLLLNFFKQSPYTKCWFVTGGACP